MNTEKRYKLLALSILAECVELWTLIPPMRRNITTFFPRRQLELVCAIAGVDPDVYTRRLAELEKVPKKAKEKGGLEIC